MIQIFYSRHSPLFECLAILATTAACFGMTWMVASALTWIQRPEVLYVTAFLILQTGLVIVVTLVLLIFKLALNRSEEMRARRLLPFEDLVAGLVTAAEDPAELLNLAEEYPRDFFRVVGKSLDLLEGSARQRVTEVAVQTSAYQKLLAESARSNPNRAIKGVLMLGKLNAKGASAAIEDALNHPIRLVRLAAQEALVRTQGRAAANAGMFPRTGSLGTRSGLSLPPGSIPVAVAVCDRGHRKRPGRPHRRGTGVGAQPSNAGLRLAS